MGLSYLEKVKDLVLLPNLNFNLGKFPIATNYIQVAGVVVLLFILVMMMARFRHHYVHWSMKGAVFGIFWGFLLALILEGFLIISGRTALTEILGWKKAPKPILVVLDAGRNKLTKVLGITSEVPSSMANEEKKAQDVIDLLQSLSPDETQKAKSLICQ